MKANKHENIDISQPVELTVNLKDLGEFVITGMHDEVIPYAASHTEAPQAPVKAESHNVASYALEATVEPANGIRADIRAAVHDFRFGTHFLSALHEQRQLRKDLAMAQSLGLLAVPVCAKHREQLEAVKSIR